MRVSQECTVAAVWEQLWRKCEEDVSPSYCQDFFQQNLLENALLFINLRATEHVSVVSNEYVGGILWSRISKFHRSGAAVTTLCIIFNTNSEVHTVTQSRGGSVGAFHFWFVITACLVTKWDIKIIYNLNIMLPEPMYNIHIIGWELLHCIKWSQTVCPEGEGEQNPPQNMRRWRPQTLEVSVEMSGLWKIWLKFIPRYNY